MRIQRLIYSVLARDNLNSLKFSCCLLLLSCAAAIADDRGIYVGFGLMNVVAEEQNIESSENSFRLIGAYSFNQHFSVEAALFDIGDHTSLGMAANGFSVGLTGRYPITNKIEVFAELGGMILDLDIDEANTTIDRSGEESLRDGKDPGNFIAFGAYYHLERWSIVLKNAMVDTDADLAILSLNALYRF